MHTRFRQKRKTVNKDMEFKAGHLVIIVVVILSTNVLTLRAQLPQYGPPSTPAFPSSTFPSSSSSSSSSSSCVNKLVPCLNYLNTTRDLPDSCCDPLKEVIKSDQQCLCQLISTQGTFQAQLLGINISQVEMLPERCGQRVNPLACLKGATKNSVQNSAGVWSFSRLMMLICGGLFLTIVTL